METPVVHEQSHPGPLQYVLVGTVLAIVTAIEVGVYYVEALKPALVAILLPLSAFKFAMVVLFFMHLKFDNKLFSILFVGGLVLAGLVLLALFFLFLFSGNTAGLQPVAPAAH